MVPLGDDIRFGNDDVVRNVPVVVERIKHIMEK